ncbi:hypothetical protein O3P69_013303 [Scylla paramamosain]|uniref:Uncharacterized protein n=1 Tax=Scylla paramamosain TaxID=85552 RepID=A0AAW0U181_SCYPA
MNRYTCQNVSEDVRYSVRKIPVDVVDDRVRVARSLFTVITSQQTDMYGMAEAQLVYHSSRCNTMELYGNQVSR